MNSFWQAMCLVGVVVLGPSLVTMMLYRMLLKQPLNASGKFLGLAIKAGGPAALWFIMLVALYTLLGSSIQRAAAPAFEVWSVRGKVVLPDETYDGNPFDVIITPPRPMTSVDGSFEIEGVPVRTDASAATYMKFTRGEYVVDFTLAKGKRDGARFHDGVIEVGTRRFVAIPQ